MSALSTSTREVSIATGAASSLAAPVHGAVHGEAMPAMLPAEMVDTIDDMRVRLIAENEVFRGMSGTSQETVLIMLFREHERIRAVVLAGLGEETLDITFSSAMAD